MMSDGKETFRIFETHSIIPLSPHPSFISKPSPSIAQIDIFSLGHQHLP